ncbi:DUF1642 domain-containing protein [Lactococcus lactis]|uniref:DUF1642 domain-containing protein n=1 Tax=Lactococcus lactis TaxID=1358 RepID=UPI002072FCAD|nr:DUF1642 domain-containing protein [Lactococcus lactis]MCM6845430.1 DUF1642 domain-containing protein [Lactococcus lactis]
MKFTKGSYIGDDIVIELSKAENLELRRALNQCKKEDVAQIQLNSGKWFMPFVVEKEQVDEPKLQQQALPVVPECVAEWIEILKTKGLKPLKNPETYEETGFTEETLQDIVFWISEHQEDYMRAWLDGYTVEKPQLFYLKNKLTGAYLYYDEAYGEATNLYSDIFGNIEDFFGTKTKFTQQEIDSMQTGSYELVPVEDGE